MPDVREIRCLVETEHMVPWAELRSWETNALKDEATRDVERLAAAIADEGFAFPFYVWAGGAPGERYIIDGATRLAALERLESVGYPVEALPVVYIRAQDRTHAQRLALFVTSQYGQVTQTSMDRFVASLDMPPAEVELLAGRVRFPKLRVRLDANSVDPGTLEGLTPRRMPDAAPSGRPPFQEHTEQPTGVICPDCGARFVV